MIVLALMACQSCRVTPPDTSPTESGDTAEILDTGPFVLSVSDWTLLPAGETNVLLPLHFGMDLKSRRAFSVSLGLGSLAVTDLDSHKVVDTVMLPEGRSKSRPIGDGEGGAWLYFPGKSILDHYRVDGTVEQNLIKWNQVNGVASLPDDQVLLVGRDSGGAYRVTRFDDRMKVKVTAELEDLPEAVAPVDDGHVAVLMREGTGGRVLICAVETLDCTPRQATPITGDFELFSDGGVAVITQTEVAYAPLEGEAVLVEEGVENKTVFIHEDEIVVLDRIGGDPDNWGELRRYDRALKHVTKPVTTGKNTGYGAVDPVTGWLWFNSEGTTDVWVVDPRSGAVQERIPLGIHVESVAPDPRHPARVIGVGRLTNELFTVNLATGEVNHAELDDQAFAEEYFMWPVAPVGAGGRIWVADQLEAQLHALDPDTLELLQTVNLGLGADTSLTIGDMEVHPETGHLFYAAGGRGVLVEVDPRSGELLGSWSLVGDVLSDDVAGRIEVLFNADGEVITVRAADGTINLIDPEETGIKATNVDLVGEIPVALRMQYAAMVPDEDLLFVGPYAFDAEDLERSPGDDQGWTFLAGVYEDQLVFWREGDDDSPSEVGAADGLGEEEVVLASITDAGHPPEFFRVEADPGLVGYTSQDSAGFSVVAIP